MKNLVILNETHSELAEFCKKLNSFNLIGISDSGSEGLTLIKTHKPDAIILDLVLKDIDGLTLLERIAELDYKPKTIVYSAFDSDEIIRCSAVKGASLYLVKPLSPKIVMDRLEQLFLLEPTTHVKPTIAEVENSHYDTAMENRISNVFLSAGIPPHIKGYSFLRTGVKLVIKDPSLLGNITKELYPQIANEYNTSSSKVERAIRHAIEVAWNRGRIEKLNAIFGVTFYHSGDKPTNGEFIALIADRIIQEIHMGKLG